MSGTFSGLNISLSGIIASRLSLDVTSQNIANANNEGYSRQQAITTATKATSTPGVAGQIGTGVQVSEIRRMRDAYLDSQLRQQSSSLKEWTTTSNYLSQVEDVLNEPSKTGISASMSNFWASWDSLNSDPSSYSARSEVIESASVLADGIRSAYTQLTDLRQAADDDVASDLGNVNLWSKEVASLNKQIVTIEVSGDNANDLRDKRDVLLDKMAETVDIGYEEQSDGSVTVWLKDKDTPPDLGGADTEQSKQVLVVGNTNHYLLETAWDPATSGSGTVVWDGDGDIATTGDQAAADVDSGDLGAVVELRDVALNPFTGDASDHTESLTWQLDQLAKSLITSVNSLHSSGHGLSTDDADAALFFAVDDGSGGYTASTGAADLQVNEVLENDPNLIRAASTAVGMPGDGGTAQAIGELADKTNISFGGQTSSFSEWYNALITRLGTASSEAETMTKNQQLLVDSLTTRKESVSGVSLDEEATNMIRFQRAYEAAARTMTTMDEMLDKLINGTGRVGL